MNSEAPSLKPDLELIKTKYTNLSSSFDSVAWVPTIIGRLNFSRISIPDLPECKTTEKNDRTDTVLFKQRTLLERRLFVSTVVDWKDTKNPTKDGEFRVVLSANVIRTDDNDKCLQGSIYIYPHEYSGKGNSDAAKKFTQNFTEKFSKLNNLNRHIEHHDLNRSYIENLEESDAQEEKLRNKASELLNQMVSYMDQLTLSEPECYKINFVTKKNGLTFLKYAGSSDEVTEQIAIRQSFYYIKYCLHVHKHHSKQDDSLTTPHKVIKNLEKDAALAILDELKQSIVDIKVFLHANKASNHQIEGIVSYCRALVSALEQEKILQPEQAKYHQFLLSNYLGSANAISQKLQLDSKFKTELSNKVDEFVSSSKQGVMILLAIASLFSIFYFNAYSSTEIQDHLLLERFIFIPSNLKSFLFDVYIYALLFGIIFFIINIARRLILIYGERRNQKVTRKLLDLRVKNKDCDINQTIEDMNHNLQLVKKIALLFALTFVTIVLLRIFDIV